LVEKSSQLLQRLGAFLYLLEASGLRGGGNEPPASVKAAFFHSTFAVRTRL
jgi:hypothetical protein